ncbi:MAG: RimK family alpha-L-glutamate ligase [Hyphomicrobiaceae bacterium]|nr:RimK family alpha-L-glutamate ligase [Hyphomicrobiaceae bacterium]
MTAAPPRVVIFVEDNGGDWHAARLGRALRARGAEVVVTSLPHCAFDTGRADGIHIPGFPDRLPDGAFVRAVSTGTLEQITLRLGILHALAHAGVRVWNSARAIERCVDKSMATFLLQQAGLPVPLTRTVEGRERALCHARGRPMPLVVKPMFGSQGNGVRRIEAADALPPESDVAGVYYMQEYLRAADADEHEDWRVFVSAGRVVAGMARRSRTWITNVHQGATPSRLVVSPPAERLAVEAAAAVGADYAGVDLIAAADGRLLVLEINSNPAWKGLQSVTDVDIAERLAEDFIAAVTGTAVAVAAPAARASP